MSPNVCSGCSDCFLTSFRTVKQHTYGLCISKCTSLFLVWITNCDDERQILQCFFYHFRVQKHFWSDLLCSSWNCLEIKFKIHLDSMWNNPKVSLTVSNCLKIQWKCFIFVLMSNQLETILTNKIGYFFLLIHVNICNGQRVAHADSLSLFSFDRKSVLKSVNERHTSLWEQIQMFQWYRKKNGMSRHNVHLFYLSRHDET